MKGPLLRELCALDAALGRKRVDWDLPTLSEESLRERIAKREEQARSRRDRRRRTCFTPHRSPQVRSRREKREKDELLGKVEATLWKLGEEARGHKLHEPAPQDCVNLTVGLELCVCGVSQVPVSIGALNVTELRVLHKKLRRKLGES